MSTLPQKHERKAVISKYVSAPKAFKGIGLSPMESIPFADDYPPFEDPSKLIDKIKHSNESGALIPSAPALATLPLTDFAQKGQDIMYYGQLFFGSDHQNMSLDFDTGSADLWAISDCDSCPRSEQYETRASTTYRDLEQEFSVSYVSVFALHVSTCRVGASTDLRLLYWS
jgi:hypothetical protein